MRNLILLLPFMICSEVIPCPVYPENELVKLRRGLGLSLYTVFINIDQIDNGYPGIGINIDGFIGTQVSLIISGTLSLGGGLDAGCKFFPLYEKERLHFQPFIGCQAGIFTLGLFTIDRFKTVTPLVGIQFCGKKGFLVGTDAGFGIVNVERIKSWGASYPNDDGNYGCFSYHFFIGYRFKKRNF